MFHWNRSLLRAEADEENEGGGGAGGVDAPVAAAEPPNPLAALQAQIDALKAENAEKDESARFWHDKAKEAAAGRPGAAKEPPAGAPAATAEDDEDPIELLSKEGSKGFDKLIEKRGYAKKADVDKMVNARAALLTEENALFAEFPELKDKKSEFHKETSQHYQAMTAAGVPGVQAMRLAAEKTALEQFRSGKRTTKADQEALEERAAAASGDRTRRGGKTEAEATGNEPLTPLQKQICEEMGVSEKAYRERANKGPVYYGHRIG